MRLHAFRIKNFRSIVDTGFRELSPDGVSLIVGQNESGKSSVLDGIYAFETGEIIEDDIRSNGSLPEVTCIFKFDSYAELTVENIPEDQLPKGFKEVFEKLGCCISIKRTWKIGKFDDGDLEVENEMLKAVWVAAAEEEKKKSAPKEPIEEVVAESSIDTSTEVAVSEATETKTASTEKAESAVLSVEKFAEEIYTQFPTITMFEDNSLLPPTIDLNDIINKNTKADGYEGAKNFLLIADIKAVDLQSPASIRIIGDNIDEKNKKVNSELQKYWHQTVGKKDKIEVIMELKNHASTVEGKQGLPYLTFWIKDKNGRLSPVQRSKGVKWFVSFYLKLEATAKQGSSRVFLIDEPGANLHAKAQKDILSVFEKQKENIQIIFTTHSPYLLDVDKVYRVLAVERADTEDEKSETQVIAFQNLGSASIDTLLPLYTNMGVDASHQNVIKHENNVLLEEISAFFYLKAFWKIFARTEQVSFLPATGCPNLPLLANLMLGWGLSFAVVLDDDSHGRKVFKELKDSKVAEESKLIKISGCTGIEDLFSATDFAKVILRKPSLIITKANSDYMKEQQISKVIAARDFMIAADSGKFKKTDLSTESKDKINDLLEKIAATLSTPTPVLDVQKTS